MSYTTEEGVGSRLHEIKTNVVLLSDSGGRRRRRETNATLDEVQEDKQLSLSRGYKQTDDLLNNVDIPDEAIKSTLKKKNLTKEENVSFIIFSNTYLLDAQIGLSNFHSILVS